ncbi:MAG: efflux RND transporter periplasmic adaptor subunit [Aquificae bacterium]|nr:efflux RND transporter periplasmic adaptor subunit [Aquificota bacterium]
MRRLLLFLVLAGMLFGGAGHDHHEEEHADEVYLSEEQMKALGITLYTVRYRPVEETLRVPAEVKENPMLSYEVYSPLEGIVRKLYVKEGDKVKKGQILAEVFSPTLAEILSELRKAEAYYKTAEEKYERYRKLYEQKVIKFIDFFNVKIEYERAKREYRILSEKLKAYGRTKGYNLLITSPGEGYVISQSVVVGDSVDIEKKLFSIHSHEVLWVYGFVPPQKSLSIKEGTHGIVLVNGREVPCRIDYVGHEVDEKTRRVKVRCVAENPDHVLKPNLFVDLLILMGKEKGIVVPKSAVQEIEGKTVVFKYENGKFHPKEIEVLREVNSYLVVRGLKEGEVIASTGTLFLKKKIAGFEAVHTH